MDKLKKALVATVAIACMVGFTAGCGGDSDCETRWRCSGGACVCDTGPQEGEGCTLPDDTTEDDPANCDNYCHYCE